MPIYFTSEIIDNKPHLLIINVNQDKNVKLTV